MLWHFMKTHTFLKYLSLYLKIAMQFGTMQVKLYSVGIHVYKLQMKKTFQENDLFSFTKVPCKYVLS